MAAAFDASAAKVRWSEVGWAELEKEVRAFLEMRAKAAIGEKQRKREREVVWEWKLEMEESEVGESFGLDVGRRL